MDLLNKICWAIATVLLIGVGLYYSFKLHGVQFRFKSMIKALIGSNKDSEGVSPFETLTLALAARIGVGSLAGIAIGIYNGGIGIIFWVWLSCLITIPNTFVESILAVLYRERDGKYFKGGPAYYISKGLHNKTFAAIYAIVITICYLGGFIAIQSNTMSASIQNFSGMPTYLSGIIISIISFLIIYKGLKQITKFTAKLVPFMGIGYLIICLIVVGLNIKDIPMLFLNIFKAAFNIKALGWGIISSIIIGVQRGIFSSESGIGTGACASGTSDTDEPSKQGLLQMFGVYFTTFVVCTSTAIIIISSKLDLSAYANSNGIEMVSDALNIHLGAISKIILLLAILTFAFSTIISGYYYGESNLKYLFKKISNKTMLKVKFVVICIIMYGSIATPSTLWNVVDIGVGLLAIINVIAIFMLRRDVIKEYFKKE